MYKYANFCRKCSKKFICILLYNTRYLKQHTFDTSFEKNKNICAVVFEERLLAVILAYLMALSIVARVDLFFSVADLTSIYLCHLIQEKRGPFINYVCRVQDFERKFLTSSLFIDKVSLCKILIRIIQGACTNHDHVDK